jgi:hypothetical protein
MKLGAARFLACVYDAEPAPRRRHGALTRYNRFSRECDHH